MDLDRQAALRLQRASFVATLAFGRQVLWMLFMAGAGAWVFLGQDAALRPVLWTVLATALAYFSQQLVTLGRPVPGLWLQLASLACAGMAFLGLFFLIPVA